MEDWQRGRLREVANFQDDESPGFESLIFLRAGAAAELVKRPGDDRFAWADPPPRIRPQLACVPVLKTVKAHRPRGFDSCLILLAVGDSAKAMLGNSMDRSVRHEEYPSRR